MSGLEGVSKRGDLGEWDETQGKNVSVLLMSRWPASKETTASDKQRRYNRDQAEHEGGGEKEAMTKRHDSSMP